MRYITDTRWDIESFTKLLWNKPWEKPFGADWVKVKTIIIIMKITIIMLLVIALHWCGQAHENGSRVHVAEPRHATTAITEDAIAVMENHKVINYDGGDIEGEKDEDYDVEDYETDDDDICNGGRGS